jgi:glycosyltransferase involved in cell wall biosynthesis
MQSITKDRDFYIVDPDFPLISIVTPSFNQGAFIRETVESVLSQDYPNLQYVVIDGQSTDDTVSILAEYSSDARFSFISEKDAGQSDAINKGWNLCHGDIVAWLCSDDLYYNNSVLTVVEKAFRSNPDVSVVHGRSSFIDAVGQLKYETHLKEVTRELLMRGVNPVYQPSSFIRRHLFDTVGYIREDLNYLMDFEYWLRTVEKGHSYLACDQVFSKYRIWEKSKTFSSTDRFTEELLMILLEYNSPYLSNVRRKAYWKRHLKFLVDFKRKYEWQFSSARKLIDYIKFKAI